MPSKNRPGGPREERGRTAGGGGAGPGVEPTPRAPLWGERQTAAPLGTGVLQTWIRSTWLTVNIKTSTLTALLRAAATTPGPGPPVPDPRSRSPGPGAFLGGRPAVPPRPLGGSVALRVDLQFLRGRWGAVWRCG